MRLLKIDKHGLYAVTGTKKDFKHASIVPQEVMYNLIQDINYGTFIARVDDYWYNKIDDIALIE